MSISATLLGLSIGTITPARATLALVLGITGYALAEHESERRGDMRPLAAALVSMLLFTWAFDVHADDGPLGVAGPVLEGALGAGLVGAVCVAVAVHRALSRSHAMRARRLSA